MRDVSSSQARLEIGRLRYWRMKHDWKRIERLMPLRTPDMMSFIIACSRRKYLLGGENDAYPCRGAHVN